MTKLHRKPESLNTLTEVAAMDIIVRPLITEKATRLTEVGQYVFEVSKQATKFSIKAAVEKLFSVKVEAVNTLNTLGKTKKFRGRLGFRSGMKKAVVTLSKGQSIDLASGV